MPDRLNILVVQGVVGLLEINPEAHSLGHLFPIADIAHDRFATATGKFLYANLFLDFFFVKDTQFFFDLMLNRQTMCIPPCFSGRVKTTHGFESWIDILETARQDMVNARFAVGGRGALVK